MDHKQYKRASEAHSTYSGDIIRRNSRFFALIFILPLILTGCLQVQSTKPVQSQAQTIAQTQTVTQPILTAVPAPKPAVGIVSAGKANLRSAPSTDSEILGQALQGDELVILKADHTLDWHQVEYNGQPAYIRSDLIVLEIETEVPGSTTTAGTQAGTKPDGEIPTDVVTTGKVNTGTVNIRSEAATSSSILGKAYGGAIINVTKAFYTAEWHQVEFEGEIGYVHIDLLDLAETNE